MGSTTGISWTDATWNPIRGCSRVSQGCVNCYAEQVASRFSSKGQPYEGLIRNGRWNGTVRVIEEHMLDPIRWRRPRKIFVNSMSDLFHENLHFEDVARVFAVMDAAKHQTFQILTKRPARMVEFFGDVSAGMSYLRSENDPTGREFMFDTWPLPNVWVGVSVEDQATADERIPQLLKTPAAVRWISAEPLLEGVDLDGYLGKDLAIEEYEDGSFLYGNGLDWVVVGGESGPGYRTMDVGWVDDVAAVCASEGVPLFVKQDSAPKPGKQGRIPDELWARKEFPAVAR